MLQSLIVYELEFIDLVKSPSFSFIIYCVNYVQISLSLITSSNPVLQISIILAIAIPLDSSEDIERPAIISVTTTVPIVL
jgi:hypothetical protein